jgi:hypothetical protein
VLTAAFWAQAIERALKSAAQALLIVWGASQINVLSIANWTTALSVVLSAAVVSLLTSVASVPFGPSASPSLVEPLPPLPVPVVPVAVAPKTRTTPARGTHEKG